VQATTAERPHRSRSRFAAAEDARCVPQANRKPRASGGRARFPDRVADGAAGVV